MSPFVAELRLAWRSLRKRRGMSLLAVVTMALGLGATTCVYAVFDAVLVSPLPYPNSDRLMVVTSGLPSKGFEITGLSMPDYRDYRQQLHSFESIELWAWQSLAFSRENRAHHLSTLRTSPGLLTTLGVKPLLGRTFLPEETEQSRVVVLSYGFWKGQAGGESDILGRTLELDRQPWTVVGVMPQDFEFPQSTVALWTPMSTSSPDRTQRSWRALGRLRPGVTAAEARLEAETVALSLAKEYPDSNRGWVGRITGLKELRVGSLRPQLTTVLAAVGLLLAIACANVGQLTLARGLERSGELATRMALGASRGRLFGMFTLESALVAVFGGVLGLALAAWGVAALAALAPAEIPRVAEITLSPRVLAFSALLTLIAGPLLGLLPAFELASRAGGAFSGRSGLTASRSARRFRSVLTVAQLALSLALLSGAGLLVRSLTRVLAVDPGFEPEQAVAVELFDFDPTFTPQPQRWRQLARGIEERVAALPGVAAVGIVNALPLSPVQGGSALLEVEGRAEAEAVRAGYRTMTPGALAALGRRLVAGRAFTNADDAAGVPVVMLSEAAVRAYFGGESPIGRRVRIFANDEPWALVVGVLADIRTLGLERAPEPELYFPYDQQPTGALAVVVRSAGPRPGLLEAVQEAIWKAAPLQPAYRAVPLLELVRDHLARRRFFTTALLVFASLALLLASIGLYGVISASVRGRRGEMAVRMALGARPAQIRRLVLGEGAKLTGLGLALGLVLSAVGARAVAAMLFDTPPVHPLTLALTSAILAIVALFACLAPARRAGAVAPSALLRGE